MWTQQEAIEICKLLEEIVPSCGGHVALTGGCLYKEGPRKDLDILIYRIRHERCFNWKEFFKKVAIYGIILVYDFGWCKKAMFHGRSIDFLDPEASGEYPVALPDFLEQEDF